MLQEWSIWYHLCTEPNSKRRQIEAADKRTLALAMPHHAQHSPSLVRLGPRPHRKS